MPRAIHPLATLTIDLVRWNDEHTHHRQDSCSVCRVSAACRPCGMTAADAALFNDVAKTRRQVLEGTLLRGAAGCFPALFVVLSGTLKSHNVQRVMAFHLPGDFIGLDAIEAAHYRHDVWAMEDSEVCAMSYAQLTALAHTAPALQLRLIRLLSASLSACEQFMLTLGNMTAEQRIAWFLLSLSARYEQLGCAADRFVLRMRQADIASHLGITCETVSRVIGELKKLGVIATSESRWKYPEVELREMETLRRIVDHPA